AFRDSMPEEAESRKLSMGLVAAYRMYEDDGIAPMVQALENEDYGTFYFVNNQFGMDRSRSFDEALTALRTYTTKHEALFHAEADKTFVRAQVVIGVGVAIGLLLVILVRLLFGRTVIHPLRQAGHHFDRIAGGDLT